MKTTRWPTLWLGLLLVLIAPATHAAEAEVHLVNESVRMRPGVCSCGGGFDFTLYFSSAWTEFPQLANGEMAPLPQPANYSHWTFMVLEDISMFASTAYAELDLPVSADTNQNGTPDFYEPTQAVAATTYGRYPVVWGPGYGQLILTWTRAAGALLGSCQLYMNDPLLGLLGPFNHPFELIEYSGSLQYAPGASTVTGTVNLQRNGDTPGNWSGPITLTKSLADPINLLTLGAGVWTNQSELFAFAESPLTRQPNAPTVYHAALRQPAGAWRAWQMSILDRNDANTNGIPDLSDTPIVVPPQPAVLALAREGNQLRLSVSGAIGRTHRLQHCTNLLNHHWITTVEFIATNQPHTLTLPLPPASSMFWRIQVE